MKLLKPIALTIFLTLGIFCAILYTSCQKDACKGVTCLNKGICSGGSCYDCPNGIGGSNCQIIYRNLYNDFAYKGVVTASGKYDSTHSVVDSICVNNTLTFVAPYDSMYQNMNLTWSDSTGKVIMSTPIVLSNNSSNGSDFTVTGATVDTFTFNGTGNINSVSASMSLTRSHKNGSSTIVFLFNNFSHQ
jgi:hypothetical protein